MEIAKLTARDAGLDMMSHTELSEELTQYADGLVKHYGVHKKEIDEKLAALMRDWDYKRIAAIDRNILRMAATELLYEPDIPPAVTIDEAVEIAKKYGALESSRFVNGVLGSLLKESPKADWKSGTSAEEKTEEEPEPEIVEVTETEAEKILNAGLWRERPVE